MSLIRLHDVTIRFDDALVLREVFFRLEPGDRVGLIGKNGSGKTTLLKLILRQLMPDDGTVFIDDGIRIGYFSQFSELDGSATITEVLDKLFGAIHVVEAELASIDLAMADPAIMADADALDRVVSRQADLFQEMERLDGWEYQRHIDTALTVLGFSEVHRTIPIDELSGGWRNRAALAKLLLERPDVLLFDEPTNFLDIAGVEWLEGWCQTFGGATIIVSHDRGFLDAVVNRMVEVENYHLHEYDGNFSEYVTQKHFRLKTLDKQFEHEASLLAFEAEGIASRREAAKVQAGSGNRSLGRRLSRIKKSRGPRPVDQIITEIYRGLHIKDTLCRVEQLTKAYGDQLLFRDLSFDIKRGQRIAVLGPNGAGKTTLMRVLVGDEPADSGEVAWTRGPSYVSYNKILDELDDQDTVTHAVNALPDSLAFSATRKSVNRFLAMFRFSEADRRQRIGTLSGGQRARVAMAQCLLSGASVLLLDEPTNHLDVTSTQVMERALVRFPGAVVVVSHDRFFISKVTNRHILFGAEGSPAGQVLIRSA